MPAMILVLHSSDCPPCMPGIKQEISRQLIHHDVNFPNKYVVTPTMRKVEIQKLLLDLGLNMSGWNCLSGKSLFKKLNNTPQPLPGAKMYLVVNPENIKIIGLKKKIIRTLPDK